MYRVFEITESGDAVLRGSFEVEQEAIEASEALASFQIEMDLGWGSQIIKKATIESGDE
jgi:hypothetical protein